MNKNSVVGKKAYKKHGYFYGRIGILQISDSGISPYKLVFEDGSAVGTHLNAVCIVDE